MKSYLSKLKNSSFSVLLLNRKDKAKTINLNIKGRKVLTVEEITNFKSVMQHHNKNCDIYIKPEQGNFYNCVVDDLTKNKLNELLTLIYVDLVICSSSNNYQAIINLKKSEYSLEQANHIVQALNKSFGDPNFSGANHYFRMVGFRNKKPTNNNEKVELIEFENKVSFEQSQSYLKSLLREVKTSAIEEVEVIGEKLTEQEQRAIRREVMAEIGKCKKIFQSLDMSAVDFRIVQRLAKQGYTRGQVKTAMQLFTDFEDRHNNPEDYLNRTINKGFSQTTMVK